MSRTENTTPYRLWQRYGLVYTDAVKRYRFGHHSYTKWAAQHANRRARRIAREQLRKGAQPEPYRPRNAVKWWAV